MEERKMSNPTTITKSRIQRSSRLRGANQTVKRQALQDDRKSFKYNSRQRNTPKTSISDTTTTTLLITFSDHFLLQKHSPRTLMSYRLHRRNPPSPPDRSWSVQEILQDRRAAITSGRLKGRRLFRDEREEIVMDDWSGGVEFDQLTCGFPVEKVVVEEEERAVQGAAGKRGVGGGGGYVAAMAWIAFVLILVTVGVMLMSCSGDFVEENELCLVPT